MRASVVIPTRNRAARVDALLATLTRQLADRPDFEVVVVDNGSTDHTAAVVAQWAERHPFVRLVTEPVAGVCRARNTGSACARGEILAFLDDDVIPDEGWLDATLHGFARVPDTGIVCGPTRLRIDGPRPRWFGPQVECWFSALDFGPEPRVLDDPDEVPWSLNLAVRADLARAVGGFPEHLGRVGDDLRSGEEHPFVARVRERGARVAYEPAARVEHAVPAERLRLRWLLRRAWAQGCVDRAIQRATTGTAVDPHPWGALGQVVFRGWRTTTRRVRRAESPGEALAADMCWRSALLGSAWTAFGRHGT